MNMREISNRIDTIIYYIVLIIVADCCLCGAGRIIIIRGLGFRLLLCILAVLLSFISILLNKNKPLLINKYTISIGVFYMWLVFETVYGFINGNNQTILLSDIKGFAYLLLIFPCTIALNNYQRIKKIIMIIAYTSMISTALYYLILFIFYFDKDMYHLFYLFIKDYYLGGIGVLSDNIPRLFFNSSMWLIPGILSNYYLYTIDRKTFRILAISAQLFVILITFTRSVYLALFISVLLFAIFNFKKSFVKMSLKVIVYFLAIAIVLSISFKANYLYAGLGRILVTFNNKNTTSIDSSSINVVEYNTNNEKEKNSQKETEHNQIDYTATIESDELRDTTVNDLLVLIKQSPVIGNGLGATISSREKGLNEYIYLDILAKMGVIGLFLYFLSFIMITSDFVLDGRKLSVVCCFYCSLLGFIVFSWFNPYMNASLGITMYCIHIAITNNIRLYGIYDQVLSIENGYYL